MDSHISNFTYSHKFLAHNGIIKHILDLSIFFLIFIFFSHNFLYFSCIFGYWILDYNSYEMEIELMSKISAPNLTFEPIFSNKKVG